MPFPLRPYSDPVVRDDHNGINDAKQLLYIIHELIHINYLNYQNGKNNCGRRTSRVWTHKYNHFEYRKTLSNRNCDKSQCLIVSAL